VATIYCVWGAEAIEEHRKDGRILSRVKQRRCKTGSNLKRYVKYSGIGAGGRAVAAVDVTKILESHTSGREGRVSDGGDEMVGVAQARVSMG